MRIALIILSLTLLAPGVGIAQNKIPAIPIVSMVHLIATPEKFDGKRIVVLGFLHLDQQAHWLFMSKEDYDNVILPNTLWVDTTEEMGRDRLKSGFNYVRIEGTFQTGHDRENSFSAGGITQITSCKLWSNPARPLEDEIKSRHP